MEPVTAKLDVSERFACKLLGQQRSTRRKVAGAADDEAALTGAIIDWARQYGRYGYRRVTALLRAEGWKVTTSGWSGSGAGKDCVCQPGSRSAGGCG